MCHENYIFLSYSDVSTMENLVSGRNIVLDVFSGLEL